LADKIIIRNQKLGLTH